MVLGWGGEPWRGQVGRTILPAQETPFPHVCCVFVALLPLHVSVPGGRGGAPPRAPLNLTKSHGCRSPFV